MTTEITNPIPRRVWSARNSDTELLDLEILDPAKCSIHPVGDGGMWEMTATVAVRTNGLGVLMYERVPYLVEAKRTQPIAGTQFASRQAVLYYVRRTCAPDGRVLCTRLLLPWLCGLLRRRPVGVLHRGRIR